MAYDVTSQKGWKMEKISMDKEYRYRNGEKARILCVDGANEKYPVVSMDEYGGVMHHFIDGSKQSDNGESIYDLVEVVKWQPKEGEWCLFWDDDMSYARLGRFMIITEDGKYKDHRHNAWRYCAPFDGTLPEHFKDI